LKWLITKKCDGSIVDFGYTEEPPNCVRSAIEQVGVQAVTLDMTNGTRIRYER